MLTGDVFDWILSLRCLSTQVKIILIIMKLTVVLHCTFFVSSFTVFTSLSSSSQCSNIGFSAKQMLNVWIIFNPKIWRTEQIVETHLFFDSYKTCCLVSRHWFLCPGELNTRWPCPVVWAGSRSREEEEWGWGRCQCSNYSLSVSHWTPRCCRCCTAPAEQDQC